jgi:hypothetical protein
VPVAVEDGVRTMRRDRSRHPVTAEERPDRLTLALERRRRRRVVEQDELEVGAGDGAKPAVDRLDFCARLGVDAPEDGLSEVRQVRIGKPADEAFGADDPHCCAPDVDRRRVALEQPDARTLEDLDDLVPPVRVPVVVAEHGEGRRLELLGHVREDGCLLRLAVSREVACEQNQVGVLVRFGEGSLEAGSLLFGAVDVSGRRNANGHALLIAQSCRRVTRRR